MYITKWFDSASDVFIFLVKNDGPQHNGLWKIVVGAEFINPNTFVKEVTIALNQAGMPPALNKQVMAYFKSLVELNKSTSSVVLSSISTNPAAYMNSEPREVRKLPAINEIVTHPITKANGPLRNIIINLNDEHRWTRGQVADWLETLDIDLRFSKDEKADK